MLVIDYMHMHIYVLDSNSDPYLPTVQAQTQACKTRQMFTLFGSRGQFQPIRASGWSQIDQ